MKTRREFLTLCGGAIGGAIGTAAFSSVLLPILDSCAPTTMPITPPATNTTGGAVTISLADLSESRPAKIVQTAIGPDGFPVLVTRVSAADYRAFSSRCTHQGCEVSDTIQSGDVPCLCHGSLFRLDGTVQQGPATTPLTQYAATYDATSNSLHVKLA